MKSRDLVTRARLVKHGEVVGYNSVPGDVRVIVVFDSWGAANDVYVHDKDETFVYERSHWIGIDEIGKRP